LKQLLTLLSLLIWLPLAAQQGFSFLNLPANARVAALGGYAVSMADGDLSMGYHNPALLSDSTIGQVYFLFNPFMANINRYNAVTQFKLSKFGPMSAGVLFMDYGMFEETDVVGNVVGTFKAQDYVIYLGKSHTVGPFSLGLNIKMAGSYISSTGATALLFDLGGLYRSPDQSFSVGMVIKNAGFLVTDFSPGQSTPLPFDIELGTTIKPQYMPVRFTFTSSNLMRSQDELFANDPYQTVTMANEIFRYLNLGSAFVLGENVELILGYNHRRNQELRLDQGAFGAGLSYGFMIKIKDYELRYTNMKIYASGGANFFSIKTNATAIKNIF